MHTKICLCTCIHNIKRMFENRAGWNSKITVYGCLPAKVNIFYGYTYTQSILLLFSTVVCQFSIRPIYYYLRV